MNTINYTGTTPGGLIGSMTVHYRKDLITMSELPVLTKANILLDTVHTSLTGIVTDNDAGDMEVLARLNSNINNASATLVLDKGLLRIIPPIHIYAGLDRHIIDAMGYTIGLMKPVVKLSESASQLIPEDKDITVPALPGSTLLKSDININGISMFSVPVCKNLGQKVILQNEVNYNVLAIPLLTNVTIYNNYIVSTDLRTQKYLYNGEYSTNIIYVPVPF